MADSDFTYQPTNFIIQDRFSEIEDYTDDALARVLAYMENLQALLDSLTLPDTEDIEDVELPTITPIDYSSLPSFTQLLDEFPSFDSVLPTDPVLDDIPEVSVDIPQKNFNFVSNVYDVPEVNFGSKPDDEPALTTIDIPTKPEIIIPDAPTLEDIILASPPTINIGSFDAVAPTFDELQTPSEFKYDAAAYSSDIRVDLFNKILYDLRNGGTGLDVSVEADLYARGVERQRVENERLYEEVQNQFSATGFNLPNGAYASRLAMVSNEISRKNDQLSREITISQAELAQNNTQFTTQQAVVLEQMLRDFFNQQESRTLQAAQIASVQAIEIYNALVTQQRLELEKYQAEASVFELKIRAEMNAIEAYRTEVEAARAKVEINNARVNIYNAQMDGLNTLIQMYATEMESARIQATIQQLGIEVYKAKIDAYVASLEAEKSKIQVYATQVAAEKSRADAFGTEVSAYQTQVNAKVAELEAQKMSADATLQKNQLLIDEYRVKIDKYNAEINAELKSAELLTTGYQVEASTYTAQVNAKSMEFESRTKETQAKIDLARAKLDKALAVVNSTTESYVALKQLQVGGTEGIMNVNAQIAASAMGAVNASASQTASYSDSNQTNDSTSYSESHNFNY